MKAIIIIIIILFTTKEYINAAFVRIMYCLSLFKTLKS